MDHICILSNISTWVCRALAGMDFYSFQHLAVEGFLNIELHLKSQCHPLLEQPCDGRDQHENDERLHRADFNNVEVRSMFVNRSNRKPVVMPMSHVEKVSTRGLAARTAETMALATSHPKSFRACESSSIIGNDIYASSIKLSST